jgi:hypothetical protein
LYPEENLLKAGFTTLNYRGVCTKNGMLLKISFRWGNEHDSKAFSDSTEGLEGTIVTDAGYLLKEQELK